MKNVFLRNLDHDLLSFSLIAHSTVYLPHSMKKDTLFHNIYHKNANMQIQLLAPLMSLKIHKLYTHLHTFHFLIILKQIYHILNEHTFS